MLKGNRVEHDHFDVQFHQYREAINGFSKIHRFGWSTLFRLWRRVASWCWLLKENQEHSIRRQLSAWNVGFVERTIEIEYLCCLRGIEAITLMDENELEVRVLNNRWKAAETTSSDGNGACVRPGRRRKPLEQRSSSFLLRSALSDCLNPRRAIVKVRPRHRAPAINHPGYRGEGSDI